MLIPVRVREICDVGSNIKDPHSPKCIALRARQICRISIRVTRNFKKISSRGLHVATSVGGKQKQKNRNSLACHPDKREVDHLCSWFHSITLTDIVVDGYTRSPTPAAQDLGVLVSYIACNLNLGL